MNEKQADCEHEYELISKEVKQKRIGCPVSGRIMGVKSFGHAIFYCKKCLDVQKKVLDL